MSKPQTYIPAANLIISKERKAIEDVENKVFCYIDTVDVDENNQGKGFGSLALKNFIQDMFEIGVDTCYLFAQYNQDEYKNPDNVSGLNRLVKFYNKAGFQSFGAVDSQLDQIDMILEKETYELNSSVSDSPAQKINELIKDKSETIEV